MPLKRWRTARAAAVRRLLAGGQVETFADARAQDAITSLWASLDPLWLAWDALLKATRDSIQGLEQALEQAHMDDMLAETRALRDEEETRAEIERIQERTANLLSPNADRTVSLVANVVAAASVLILVASFAVQVANLPPVSLPPWLHLPSSTTSLNDAYLITLIFVGSIAGLIAIIMLSALVYLLAQFLTGPAIRWMIHLVGRWENRQTAERGALLL